jgi:hypothetical protein
MALRVIRRAANNFAAMGAQRTLRPSPRTFMSSRAGRAALIQHVRWCHPKECPDVRSTPASHGSLFLVGS